MPKEHDAQEPPATEGPAVPEGHPLYKHADRGFGDSYRQFANLLRVWLVGYGIGAPVLLASQGAFAAIVSDASAAVPIILLFLGGVLIQVAMAFTYKAAMWYIHHGDLYDSFTDTRRYEYSAWLSNQFWLELLLDGVTIVLFSIATAWCLILLVNASTA